VTTSTTEEPIHAQSVAGQHDRMIAGVAAVLLLIGMPVAWIGGKTTTADVVGLISVLVIVLGVMAVGFLWLLPRERAASHRTARTALALGVFAVITGLVFWTGVSIAVGATAIALALPIRSEGRAATGLALGAIAMVASFVLLLVG
jgi:hypothetical protein